MYIKIYTHTCVQSLVKRNCLWLKGIIGYHPYNCDLGWYTPHIPLPKKQLSNHLRYFVSTSITLENSTTLVALYRLSMAWLRDGIRPMPNHVSNRVIRSPCEKNPKNKCFILIGFPWCNQTTSSDYHYP